MITKREKQGSSCCYMTGVLLAISTSVDGAPAFAPQPPSQTAPPRGNEHPLGVNWDSGRVAETRREVPAGSVPTLLHFPSWR